ncbi:MAG: heme-binding protein [Verrucomicrobiales bacterium]|nr:heme-binding protein [Verrucomicrobiales bacterium]
MPSPSRNLRAAIGGLAVLAALPPSLSAAPQWIWGSGKPNNEPVYFRHAFEVKEVTPAIRLLLSCDNGAEVFVNGAPVGKTDDWQQALRVKIGSFLKPGRNVIAVKAVNDGDTAGLVARVDTGARPGTVLDETGAGWKQSLVFTPGWETADFADSSWTASTVVAKLGDGPWGNVFAPPGPGSPGVVIEPKDLNLPPGFKADLVYTVPKSTQGSWVSMTLDDKQRIIACDQNGGLFRVTIGDQGEADVAPLQSKVGHAHGLLYVNKALYLVRNGGESGLYRLRDTNGDDQFDEEVLLRRLDGDGEHGPHAVVLAPDGKSLYIVAGNFTKIPDPDSSRPPRLWAEDQLITRMTDAGGHDPHIMAPAGWVAKTDFDGKKWELTAMGFRNTYDIAFNKDGELFGYDSDMEWDIGLPWYRPTRVCHIVPGADFGFRNGSGKFPTHFPDSVPPVVNIGPGSPTGVLFGYGSKFPAKYQNALFILDWTYGTMYAVHLKQHGATYTAEKEEFVSGKPLPLTDAVIRPADGAMYFAIGGRGNQSGLYRVRWAGETPQETAAPETGVNGLQKLRREIESLQNAPASPEVVAKVWDHLNHDDRFIRFAARTVIEEQPVASWAGKALEERRPWASLTSLLALARAGEKDQLIPILHGLAQLDWSTLTEEQKLAMLRTASVTLIRKGPLSAEAKAHACTKLDPLFPASSFALNRELCELLVKLDSRQVVPKAMALMGSIAQDDQVDLGNKELLLRSEDYAKGVLSAQASKPNRQQISYAYALREATAGWSPELYRQYFRWFNTARKFQGGNSLHGFMENMRKEALVRVPDSLKAELDSISGELTTTKEELPQPVGPGKAWTTEELLALTANGLSGRNFEAGHRAYKAALCSSCHRFGTEGGGVGPELSGIANRYTMRDLLDNIMEPSKVISDQYESTLIEKTDGSSVVGRIVKEEGDLVGVAENPLDASAVTSINTSNIRSRSKYPISAMPPALLYSLNQDEVLDLLAFLMSGGNPNDKAFAK